MTIEDILGILEKGLRESLHAIFYFTDNPYGEIKPEYLKTFKMGEAFKNNIENSKVIFEKNTKKIMLLSMLPPRPDGFLSCIQRNGRIDITIFHEDNSLMRPVILIENKIYVNKFNDIKLDIERCLNFINISIKNTKMSIEVTCVTFLIKIKKGVKQSDHDNLSDTIYQDILKSVDCFKTSYSSAISVKNKKILLSGGGYKKDDDAYRFDENGFEYIGTQNVETSIYGCFIIFYNNNKNKLLNKLILNKK